MKSCDNEDMTATEQGQFEGFEGVAEGFRTWDYCGFVMTNRFVGRCPVKRGGCGRKVAIVAEWAGHKNVTRCECGRVVAVERVTAGVDSKKACNARCMGAVGPSCDCKCRGENHGGK
jgi:hypothetical protein